MMNKIKKNEKKIESEQELVKSMEKARLAEYAMYIEQPWKLLRMNFFIGLARGLGSTIGLAVVLSVGVFLVQNLISANLPGISAWLAELIKNIQAYQ